MSCVVALLGALASANAAAVDPVSQNCALGGPFVWSFAPPAKGGDSAASAICVSMCTADPGCGGFTFKKIDTPPGPGVDKTSNCTTAVGQPCCYFQSAADITGKRSTQEFDCWSKPGSAAFSLGAGTTPFPHFWIHGINSPHSAMTLREDWRGHMRHLKDTVGYNYTRIHAPFARDYSVSQGPNATSYFNAFSTYDALLGMGVKPWIELGYTPCWMSGPPAVPKDSYWPTVDYGICVGPPTSIDLWTDLIDKYIGAMVDHYGVAEVETWVWVLYNEPGGINAFSPEWERYGYTYHELFWNTSAVIKRHSPNMQVGGLSDSPDQASKLASQMGDVPARRKLLDLFTFHGYCNGQSASQCGQSHVATAASLRSVLPKGLPIVLEETGSSAGPYDSFHDTTGEAAFVVPYVAAMNPAGFAGSHWWVSSDLYTEHGSIPNYTWIPNQDWSGGMPRAEFTGRWGFITPSGVPKPIARAFALLEQAGTRLIDATASPGGACSGVSIIAVANGTTAKDGVVVFVANEGVSTCDVTVDLTSWAPSGAASGWLTGITAGGAGDPMGAWVAMGSPPFPTVDQVSALVNASVPSVRPLPPPGAGGAVKVTIGPTSLAAVAF